MARTLYHVARAYAVTFLRAACWLVTERRLARRHDAETEPLLRDFIVRQYGAWRP